MNWFARAASEEYCGKDVYYYHGDHLGSATWITDANGQPVQYISPYAYCNWNPIKYVDPDGKFKIKAGISFAMSTGIIYDVIDKSTNIIILGK